MCLKHLPKIKQEKTRSDLDAIVPKICSLKFLRQNHSPVKLKVLDLKQKTAY